MRSQKKRLRVQVIILGLLFLVFIVFQGVFVLPNSALAGNVAGVNQRATLPPEWTATFTLASATAVVQTTLPTLTLGGQTTLTPIPQQLAIPAINGKQVVVDVDFLGVYTRADKDSILIENVPRGGIKTIVTEKHNPSTNETWWYVVDSSGWIPSMINGKPTVHDYSPEVLSQMMQDTENTIQDDDENATLHLQLGWMYMSQSNYEKGISEVSKAINISFSMDDQDSETYSRLYFYRGKIYLAAYDYINALRDFNEAIKLGYREAVVYGRRALTHQLLQQYDLARLDYLESIRLNPDYALTYSNFGTLFSEINYNDPNQLDYFTKAIEIEPYFPYGYANRAGYYMGLGDVGDHIIADFTTTLQLVPRDPGALNGRGIAYTNRQEFALAIKDLTFLIKLYPNYVAGYINRGIAYGNLGDNQAAFKDLKYAVKLNDPSGSAYYNLGLKLALQGQYLAALYCFNKALALNPHYNYALSGRSRLLKQLGEVDEMTIMAYPSFELLITPTPAN